MESGLFSFIQAESGKDGLDFNTICKYSFDNFNIDDQQTADVLFMLAYEGLIYQPRPAYYKTLE